MKNSSDKLEILYGLALSFVISVGAFLANSSVVGPMIQPDEGSYLASAAAAAGFHNDLSGSYSAGYSFILAPVFWFVAGPDAAWVGVRLVNALLLFMSVYFLWLFALKFNETAGLWVRLSAVFLTSLYPMWIVMSGYGFSQIAFVPGFLIVVLVFQRAVSGSRLLWIVLGLLSACLYFIHPTGIAVFIALLIACIYIAQTGQRSFEFSIFLISTALAIACYKFLVQPWLTDRMTVSGLPPSLHYPSALKMLSPLLTLEGVKNVVSRIGGHLFYLSVGSVGLFWLGIFGLWRKGATGCGKVSVGDSDNQRIAIAMFLTLSVLGILLMSVLLFSSTPEAVRLDHWMYGRYVEGALAPVLLVGAMATSFRRMVWVIPIAIVSAVLMATGLDNYSHTARFNISAFWQDFILRDEGLWVWLITGCVPLLVVALSPRRLGYLVVTSMFLCCSYIQINWHVAAAHAASERWKLASVVRDKFRPGTCVGFDHSGIDSYQKHVYWFDFGFRLFDYSLKRMSFGEWLSNCDGPLFSYDRYLDRMVDGVYSMAISPRDGPVLWVKGESEAYPIVVTDGSGALAGSLGRGWYSIESTLVWSNSEAELRLPVLESCEARDCLAVLKFVVFGAGPQRPVSVFFESADMAEGWTERVVASSGDVIEVRVSLTGAKGAKAISIKVPDATSPKLLNGSPDARVLGIALQRIDLIKD